MKTGDSKLVAYYTAMLSEEDQINYYSEFLQNIDDENERLKCLEAAELCHLQIEEITKRVVQLVRYEYFIDSLTVLVSRKCS